MQWYTRLIGLSALSMALFFSVDAAECAKGSKVHLLDDGDRAQAHGRSEGSGRTLQCGRQISTSKWFRWRKVNCPLELWPRRQLTRCRT